MIHLFTGNDTKKKRVAYDNFMIALPEGIEVFFIDNKKFDRMQIESFYSGSGLFFKQCAVVLEELLEKKEEADFILGNLEKFATSENIFILLEGKLLKPVLDNFKKVNASINIFDSEKKEKEEKFNSFTLANSLGDRNKLLLWINYCRAIEAGVELEPIAGILFWKVKDMLLKRQFNKFSEKELQNLAGKISILLPEARSHGFDAESAFEEFLLEAI